MRLLFILFLMLSGAGCSVLDTRPSEEIVSDRAQARLDRLLEGDFEGAMAFTTPGYRSTADVGHYKTQWAGVAMWTAASVKQVGCGNETVDTDLCNVVVLVTYKPVGQDPLTVNLPEQWLRVEGKWYQYQKFGE